MNSQLNEREIFLQAIEINDPLERQNLVAGLCGPDAALLDSLNRLLREHDAQTRCIIDEPLFDTDATNGVAAPGRQPGDTIGPYYLEKLLGTGGMGHVWLARQNSPVARNVAVKLIKPGLESPGVTGRFKRELRALTAMEHPNIATVLDAGATNDQQPFFVMEHVDGRPLTAYCENAGLSTSQRLEIFLQVVSGVRHAHQKAIVHRDLKPSNVLVMEVDDHPVAKIIDFGLAKALTPENDSDEVTRHGQFVGTLAYMPPEQTGFERSAIDTRSDVYSLGAVLYELLTGKHPLESEEWNSATLPGRLEILRQVDPVRPSRRLPAGREVGEDLDWIVMRALEKEPGRRYQSTGELHDDVRRFLVGKPVKAHPPSTPYRVRKFISRNRGLVAGVTAVMFALLLGLAGTSYGLWKADQNADLLKIEAENARLAQTDAESATERERQERIYSDAIAAFVQNDILRLTSVEGQLETGAWASLGKDASLSDLLVRARDRIGKREYLDPRIEPALQMMIGRAFQQTGRFDDAAAVFELCVEQSEVVFGAESMEAGIAIHHLASANRRRGKLEDALSGYERALELKQPFASKLQTDSLSDEIGIALVFCDMKEYDRATEQLEQIVARTEEESGSEHESTLRARSELANVYLLREQFENAISMYEELLEAYHREEKFRPITFLKTMNHLGLAYRNSGNPDKAIPVLLTALEKAEELLEQNSITIASIRNNLGCCYYSLRRLDDSIPVFEELAGELSQNNSPAFPPLLEVQTNLASNYREAGRTNDALLILEEIEDLSAELPSIHLWILTELEHCYRADGNDEKYEQSRRNQIEVMAEIYGPDSSRVFVSRTGLARWLTGAGKHEESEAEFRKNLIIADSGQWTGGAWSLHYTRSQLGGVLMSQNRLEEAAPLLESGYEGMRQIAERTQENGRCISNSERNSLVAAIRRLIQHAQKTGNEEQRERWTAELEQFTD
ncbi:MAG: serine/threonine-protein kinase [Planctomycetota bacterium]